MSTTRMARLAALHVPTAAASAAIVLPAIISDHMVRERAADVAIWGKANPGDEVSVSLGPQVAQGTAAGNGRWRVAFDLRDISDGPFDLAITSGGARVVVSDVVIGEVWVASGQSNMELLLRDTTAADAEISGSRNPLLRQFHVRNVASREPLDSCEGAWVTAAPESSGGFSAVGYYFAKRLQNVLNVPLGIVHASWGATPAESWMSRASLDTRPDLKAARERLCQREPPSTSVLEPRGDLPVFSSQPLPPRKTAGYLFNGTIAPLVSYAVRGIIWYQGEGNSARAFQYRTTFPLLICDWRAHWRQKKLPFYFCQLANTGAKTTEPGESAWAELREAQNLALDQPDTGQAVLIDLGEAENVHPGNKRDVGERLAMIALAKEYDGEGPYSGPVYESMKVEGATIRLTFRELGVGLAAKPLPAMYDVNTLSGEVAPLIPQFPGDQLEGFAICGHDRRWRWAHAKIEDRWVLIWSEAIDHPIAVRYGWADNPTCNLCSAAGLPASPFRTDDFPLTTRDRSY